MRDDSVVVVRYRGGIFRAFLEGRGGVVGFGKTADQAVNALRSLRS